MGVFIVCGHDLGHTSGGGLRLEKQNKPKRTRFFDKAAETFDLPGEVLWDLPRITIVAGNRVVVENHKGLMDYGENSIVIAGGRVEVRIVGTELELRAMNADELLITGDVFSVEFIR